MYQRTRPYPRVRFLSDIAEQFLGRCLLHLDAGKELKIVNR